MEISHTLNHPSTHRLRDVQQTIRSEGSSDIAIRIEDLIERLESGNRQVFVAFCGLFSAGKSSLLNALSVADVLATGAVPTTAQTHEIVLPGTNDGVILIDTPGVDSTDAAHQQETEEALHRADVITLVMDYQHVESEANLELARRCTDLSQRFILVVNQVDKHLEWELPFSTFQRRVEQTFLDWDIHYERIFYTSSNADANHNQRTELVGYLQSLFSEVDSIGQTRVIERLRDLVTEHVTRQLDDNRNEIEDALVSRIGYVPFDHDEASGLIAERVCESEQALRASAELRSEVATWFEERRAEFLRDVELAQIAPYETTERGRLYVESLRSDFKVGWLNTKHKTEIEQTSRLEAFVADLTERTEKFLIWPLRNRIREAVQGFLWAEPSWVQQVDDIDVRVTADLCKGQVKTGALVSSEYPYQYVKDVVGAIKRQVITQTNHHLDAWKPSALKQSESSMSNELQKLQDLQSDIEVIQSWLDLDRIKAERIAALVAKGVEQS